MFNLSQFLKSSMIYGFLGFLPAASKLFLFPIFVHYLSPYDYGIISLNSTMVSFLTIIMMLGFDGAFSRFFFNYSEDETSLNRCLSTILICIAAAGSLLILMVIPFGNFIHSFLYKDKTYSFFPYGIISLISGLVTSINTIILIYYRNNKQAWSYFLLAIGVFTLTTVFEFVAIVFLNCHALGVLIARLSGSLIVSFIAWVLILNKTKLRFDKNIIRPCLQYGLPILLYSFLGFFYISYDRIIIENKLSISDIGIYNTAFTIAQVSEITLYAIQYAVQPDLFKLYFNLLMNKVKIDKIYRGVGLLMILFVSLALALTPVFIYHFTRKEFQPAIYLIPVLLVGFICRYFYMVFTTPLFFFNSTARLPWLNVIAGIVTIVLNYSLIPVMGLMGTAIAMLASRAIQLPLSVFWSRKISKVSIDLKYINPLIGFIVMIILMINFTKEFRTLNSALYFIPLAVMIIVLLSIIVINKNQLLKNKKEGIKHILAGI